MKKNRASDIHLKLIAEIKITNIKLEEIRKSTSVPHYTSDQLRHIYRSMV